MSFIITARGQQVLIKLFTFLIIIVVLFKIKQIVIPSNTFCLTKIPVTFESKNPGIITFGAWQKLSHKSSGLKITNSTVS